MPTRTRKPIPKVQTKEAEELAEADVGNQAQRAELLDEMDELLDDVDAILEENAELFIRGYVQKGGQ